MLSVMISSLGGKVSVRFEKDSVRFKKDFARAKKIPNISRA